MMSMGVCCSVLLMLSLVAGAPVEKTADEAGKLNEVQKEEELQSLLQLADEKGARNDVTVHEEHAQHVHEVNGQKVEVDTARKTVSDTKTGKILSDVKQEVSKADNNAHPEVKVQTEVDVPAEGVHETIVQSGSEAEAEVEKAEAEEEFSPEAVAEYLYQTGDFNRFYAALAQLVNASVMTEEEAQSYSQMVALEYDRMQMEDFENSILVQRRGPSMMNQYPAALENAGLYPLPLESSVQESFPVPLEVPEEVYGLEREPAPKDLDMDFDPYELLYALWNEAYGAGDARAEALVSELFNKVRDDTDPDDEGQVRDILLDLIANSMSEDELPRKQPLYGWQPVVDLNTAPAMQSMENAVPVRPLTEDEEAANELMAQNEKRAAEEPTLSKNTEAAKQPTNDKSGNNSNGSKPQPKESSQTQEKEELKGKETQDKMENAPTPAPISAQKRAAETV